VAARGDRTRPGDTVYDDRLYALYELAAYAGLHRTELGGLRWSDIDADAVGLRVGQTLVSVTRSRYAGAARAGKLAIP
jgi:integrase